MLAGYLPFDDDPANPEGDNINLLYKYIVSTPLTFPEYVSPHARDLLRRILVPDPRKRADLFEVARHSWLSDYAHVVAHITSSTTSISDLTNEANVQGSYQMTSINTVLIVGRLRRATVPGAKRLGTRAVKATLPDNDPGRWTQSLREAERKRARQGLSGC